jgi:hypothetical protein
LPMRLRMSQGAVCLTVLALMSGLAMAAIMAFTSPDRIRDFASIDQELATISERAERVAAFQQNLHAVRLDAPETRTVPFAGFIASANRLKPGREIDLTRNHPGDAKLRILDVRRITQSVSVTRPAALRMDLLLVKGRLVEGPSLSGDEVLPDHHDDAEGRIISLLFAVGVPTDEKAPALSTPPLHQSL